MRPFFLLALTTSLAFAAEDKLRLVRETDALTPQQEQAALHVPPGFTVQLFASEPMINKPINMAFDARGRLWVSSTVEYPFAAAKERWADAQGSRVKDSRDAIKILEDTDGDGAADKVTDFADGLDIPTGVLPWHKPEDKDGCIAWSIPNIWYFADTDGDGKCDKREVLFGPLGYEKDTHGMCSSFRLGLDGWVYATHGFNNTSHLKAKDGSVLDLHSGNVFRFRPDGSRVELYTSGQVNPFGLCWDRYNNLYSADCHSNPISQLIRGACYSSFGKPHDGLGFAPVMCEHAHGSTGLCGIIYIDGGVWGPEWDDHIFVGNCVTSKVNHDRITHTGSTPKANEAPDFITSDDPWFRPVDLQLGPDSALYVADFYNKIIGHYEVPLDHPGRDKERGRIWRVVKEGKTKASDSDFTKLPAQQLVGELDSPNLTRQRHAIESLRSRTKDTSPFALDKAPSLRWQANALWVLSSSKALRPILLSVLKGLGSDQSEDSERENLLVQRWRVIGGLEEWPFEDEESLGSLAADDIEGRSGDLVKQAVLDALRAHPKPGPYLLTQILDPTDPNWASRYDADDSLMWHTLRLLLRDWSRDAEAFKKLQAYQGSATGVAEFRRILTAVPTEEAAVYLRGLWEAEDFPMPEQPILAHLARYLPEAELPGTIATARRFAAEHNHGWGTSVQRIETLHSSLLERGAKAPAALLVWATDEANSLLAQTTEADKSWTYVPTNNSESPWCLQDRKAADGTMLQVISSLNQALKGPEKLTGTLRSKTFAAPTKLSFWLCGHQGFPNTEANKLNLARLVDAQGRVLHQAYPPRHNDAQRIEWNLATIAGQPVRFEIVDGDSGTAYAWLGVGGFEPSIISTETFDAADSRQKQLKTLASILRTTAPVGLRDQLAAYLPQPAALAKAKPQPEIDALIKTRLIAFAKAKPDVAKGEQVFKTHCAVCHTLGGQGGLIGPQLDGLGKRGVERIVEDVLDPYRNVDAHFHLHTMKLRDGSSLTGFVRGEVGQTWIIADTAGNEQRLAKGDVTEDTELPQSLMPPTFGQTIEPSGFNDLLGFLLSK